jgi:protein-S-isoprenylcysteine O-methyltransferase Ste14
MSPQARDVLGRGAMLFYFAFGATLKAMSIAAMLREGDGSGPWVMDLLASIASFGFIILIVATTVARLPPKSSAESLDARASALIGGFAMVALVVFPKAAVSDELRTAANVVTLVGSLLCFWCLWWLGRSFSIMAQARRLVTGGPYRLVRHPLYVCEALVVAGIVLRNPTWPAFALAATALGFQYRRILHEERVLVGTFPEYAAYAERVPMFGLRLP